MSLAGILLGVINIAIVVVVLVLVGAVIVMFANWMQWPIDWNVQRLYLLVVALIALYMLVALLLGMPSLRVIGGSPFALSLA
jgi:predicted ABC-type exoprotein transport system permease subunit